MTHGWDEANVNELTGLEHFDPCRAFRGSEHYRQGWKRNVLIQMKDHCLRSIGRRLGLKEIDCRGMACPSACGHGKKSLG